ncbi:hypothetical protein KL933_002268 [Ogataea haglerorum]|uniref:Uncharacterized protein n=1 Tax=Ogataea haglerorum TaxID=1937702 RepID=A0AAN6D6B8_9ASCO|nr:uncharacterized protein KL911_002898 [Ogataea haglerorum]KAG7691933.1 hypothetical protein KL915_004996 [Ogataea haglerorum]KAG7692633.1 hypothetical protein KL951_004880 [Ogataea haglerorum]KAG7702853.1 hypothetical protein KL950_004931 [Ogataea haglerorum]KAG7702950.1 hypothetical protein KL914_004955 [Ogataea haglerorum]KAG7719000.1 hypothetical protein KL913_001998 [Ogataea haglerorum]
MNTATKFKLPRCSLLTMDAYDTLYTPREPIAVAYNRIAGAISSDAVMETGEFKRRFKSAFQSVWQKYPNYGKAAHMPIDTFWRYVLVTLYGGNYEFIDDIIKHFETREAYKVFDDVQPFLNSIKNSKVQTCIASNAERRIVRLIIDEFGLGNFFKPQDIFLSYDLETYKPDSRFFKLILEHVQRRNPVSLDEAWHVGEDMENDVNCALDAVFCCFFPFGY